MFQQIVKNRFVAMKSRSRFLTSSSYKDTDVVVVGFSRTPIGKLGGSLASFTAPKLAAHAIEGAITQSKLPKIHVEECFMGNVVSAGIPIKELKNY